MSKDKDKESTQAQAENTDEIPNKERVKKWG